MSTPSDRQELRQRVIASVLATPSPTRKQRRAATRWLIAASVVVGSAVFVSAGGFELGRERPYDITTVIVVGWTAFAALVTWLVARGAGRPSTMPRYPGLVAGAALATPVALFLWMHQFHGTYTEPFHAMGYECFRYSLSISALPLATLLWSWRGREPRYPAALGAAAAAISAAWAAVVVILWCPLTNGAHLLFGHVSPVVFATLVGAVVGRSVLRTRSTRPTIL